VSKKNIRRIFAWASLGVYWPVMFVMTHLPAGAVRQIRSNDKVAHFSAYLMLTLLYWLVRYGRTRPSLRSSALYWAILLIAVYGGVDELSQHFVEGRHASPYDWCADMAGMSVALVLVYVFRRQWHWLTVYWVAMFTVSHWPGKDGAFVRLPGSWQQFQVCFILAGYVGLTFLFWRGLTPDPKFVVNKRIIGLTLFVLPVYAFVDEWVAWAMGRGFDGVDFFSALGGIALGAICSIAFAQHNVAFQEDYDPYSGTYRR